MKIMTIVGARPQFVKAVSVSKELRRKHKEVLVHTGQHYDKELSAIFFDELDLPQPDYNLEVGSDTHARQTSEMLISIEQVLFTEKPDLVLVYGDTNSTLAGALAAAKLHIPVAHVESGPRVFDMSVPEEVNRVLVDRVSSLLFAPTERAVDNLMAEGIGKGVYLTGDVMLDSFLHFSKIAREKSEILGRLDLSKGEYLLATVHRVRNTEIEENLSDLVNAFTSIKEKIVFPVHPRTQKYLRQYGLVSRLENTSNIVLIPPVSYLDSIMLTANARMVLTDSGGLQKEAYFAGVPCITLDEVSGWPETIEDGWNTVVESDKEKILEAIKYLSPEGKRREVFGDGKAAEKIIKIISDSGF